MCLRFLSEFDNLNGSEGSSKRYAIKCYGPCTNIKIVLTYDDGDPDLYGREDRYPSFTNRDCDASVCSLCRSRETASPDRCTVNSGKMIKMTFETVTLSKKQ